MTIHDEHLTYLSVLDNGHCLRDGNREETTMEEYSLLITTPRPLHGWIHAQVGPYNPDTVGVTLPTGVGRPIDELQRSGLNQGDTLASRHRPRKKKNKSTSHGFKTGGNTDSNSSQSAHSKVASSHVISMATRPDNETDLPWYAGK